MIRQGCLDWIIRLAGKHRRETLREWSTHYSAGRPRQMFDPSIAGPAAAARTICARMTMLACAALPASVAWGQAFPVKSIRLIVPFAAGGSTDVIARVVGQKMAEGFGQQIVIDNRPGAASSLGTELAARAAPDGYSRPRRPPGEMARHSGAGDSARPNHCPGKPARRATGRRW